MQRQRGEEEEGDQVSSHPHHEILDKKFSEREETRGHEGVAKSTKFTTVRMEEKGAAREAFPSRNYTAPSRPPSVFPIQILLQEVPTCIHPTLPPFPGFSHRV